MNTNSLTAALAVSDADFAARLAATRSQKGRIALARDVMADVASFHTGKQITGKRLAACLLAIWPMGKDAAGLTIADMYRTLAGVDDAAPVKVNGQPLAEYEAVRYAVSLAWPKPVSPSTPDGTEKDADADADADADETEEAVAARANPLAMLAHAFAACDDMVASADAIADAFAATDDGLTMFAAFLDRLAARAATLAA